MCIYDAAVEFNVVEMRRIFCIKLKRPKRFYQLTVFNQNIIKRDGHLTLRFICIFPCVFSIPSPNLGDRILI